MWGYLLPNLSGNPICAPSKFSSICGPHLDHLSLGLLVKLGGQGPRELEELGRIWSSVPKELNGLSLWVWDLRIGTWIDGVQPNPTHLNMSFSTTSFWIFWSSRPYCLREYSCYGGGKVYIHEKKGIHIKRQARERHNKANKYGYFATELKEHSKLKSALALSWIQLLRIRTRIRHYDYP